jgi:hypothetical protein
MVRVDHSAPWSELSNRCSLSDRHRWRTMRDMETLHETAWLLRNRVNPFPIGGDLKWENGAIRFTIGALAGEAFVGWLESEMGIEGLAERLKSGEEVEVFHAARGTFEVTWPKMYAGSALEVRVAGGKSWLISLDYPSGGQIAQTISLFTGRRKGKAWKSALAG